MRLAIVDDHAVVAETLAVALEGRGFAEVLIFDPRDVDLVDQLRSTDLDICLIDLDLGDHRARGLELIPVAVESNIAPIIFTGSSDEPTFGRCLMLGAIGVLSKNAGLKHAVQKLEAAGRGEHVNSDPEKYRWLMAAQREQADRDERMAPFAKLTARESAVLGGLVEGLHVDEIAAQSFVSTVTIRSQVRSVFQKLEVNSQLAAVALAHRSGWESPASGEMPV